MPHLTTTAYAFRRNLGRFGQTTSLARMGIDGLTTFVSQRVPLKKAIPADYEGVVVDGKSLIYHLTDKFQITCTFGGQYRQLEHILKDFFKALLSNCKAGAVIVVFDGIDYDDQKRATKVKRKKSMYSRIRKASRENKELYLLPPLADLVFCHVLRKLGIRFIFVDGDADQKIAQIANFHRYPVIADDSDYFVFDLCAGYMPLSAKFEWERGTVSAFLYKRDFLVESTGLRSPDLVLGIPLVIGNDFYGAGIWKRLWDTPRGESGSRQAAENIELGIKFLIQFSSLNDLDHECIQKLPGGMKEPDPVRVQLMSDGLKLMKDLYDAKPPFISDPITEMGTSALMLQNDGRSVPKELLCFFREGLASLKTLEALCKDFVDLPTWFEDLDQPFCCNIGQPLRATLYALVHLDQKKLRIKEEVRCDPYENNFESASVKVARSKALPMIPRSCKTFGKVCKLPVDVRKDAILHCLQVPPPTAATVQTLPSHLQLLAMVTRYWFLQAEPKPKPAELRALILMLLHQDTRHEVTRFDRGLTHSCVQWQEVLIDVHDLNNLLSQPFPPLPPISEVFDGQLFQSLIKDKSLKNADALKCDKGLFHCLFSLASDDRAPTRQSPHPHAKKSSRASSSVLQSNPFAGLPLDDDS